MKKLVVLVRRFFCVCIFLSITSVFAQTGWVSFTPKEICEGRMYSCERECTNTYTSYQQHSNRIRCEKGCQSDVRSCIEEERQEIKDKEAKERTDRENKLKEETRLSKERADAEYAKGNYLIPSRSPDVVLVCHPVSLKNFQESYGSNSQNSSAYSSSSNSSISCGGQGWENKRLNFQIWISENRCDGYRCKITNDGYSWNSFYVNRLTGQTSDKCHIFNCEKASSVAPKF